MNIEEIRSLRNARPFTPFTVHLHSGRIFRVGMPMRIAISPRGREVTVAEENIFHSLRLTEIRQVALEPVDAGVPR